MPAINGWSPELEARALAISKNALPSSLPLDPVGHELCKVLKPYIESPSKLDLGGASALRGMLWQVWCGYQHVDFLEFMANDEYYQNPVNYWKRKFALCFHHLAPLLGQMSSKERNGPADLDRTLMARSLDLVKGT